MMAVLFLYIPILFLALYTVTIHFLNKTRNLPPSPFPCLPIIGHLHLLIKKPPVPQTLAKISNKYGPLVSIQLGSRRVVVVSSPAVAEECLTKNDIILANRPCLLFGEYLNYNCTTLAWAPYGDHWRYLRKIASLEILSTHRLQMLSSIRAEEVRSLVSKLFHEHQNGEVVNMRVAFYELTVNILLRMMAGKQYYGEDVSNMEEARRFHEIHAETIRLGGDAVLGDMFPWIVRFKGLKKRLVECQRKRDNLMQFLIEEQRKEMDGFDSSGEEKKNMIQLLLSLQAKEPEYYKDEIIKGLVLILLAAGSGSTSNVMEWSLSLLINHPRVTEKARARIDKYVGHDRLIDESDLPHLTHLHNIVNETMRMYPSAPLTTPHQSSQECVVGGFRIPARTTLVFNLWAIQNDPKLWDDPTVFKPERFEGVEGSRDGFRFMPFGYGRRGCPGEGLALRVAELALGTLIQCFEWESSTVGGGDGGKVDMRVAGAGGGFTMPKAHPLKVLCRPRPCMLNLLSQV
ncbi:hypothetical protein Tsubulata_002614 [Turnera subulata]|uniref:Cytochrome P450 n=1 Tax=Turnera subulata TaxID=218843 RepID=A0A9Q0FMX5_9ROSI|nr:hypothetical protein Tsubulata_002614 [Turnera subulata]